MPTRKGTVLSWFENRSFGLVQDDETGNSLFCHKNSLIVDGSRSIIFLTPKERVAFDLADNPVKGPNGKKCVNVRREDGTPFGQATGSPMVLNVRGATGAVCFMKIGSSYGFITVDDDPGSKIFFHGKDVKNGPVYQGDRVVFDLIPDKTKEGKAKAISIMKVAKK